MYPPPSVQAATFVPSLDMAMLDQQCEPEAVCSVQFAPESADV